MICDLKINKTNQFKYDCDFDLQYCDLFRGLPAHNQFITSKSQAGSRDRRGSDFGAVGDRVGYVSRKSEDFMVVPIVCQP